MPPPKELIELARAVADPNLEAVILGEGNVSARCGEETFWVKASGAEMGGIGPEGFVEVWSRPILDSLGKSPPSEASVREILNLARKELKSPAVPSTETFMHAYLLSLGGVEWVAHSHPVSLLSILSLEIAEELAGKRLFPDEVVLCGAATCWVPYVAPGLPLANELKRRTEAFAAEFGSNPKCFWLQNHGLIALGRTAKEAECCTRMAVKSAKVLLSALQTGERITWLSPAEIQQIANWPDEHYRQRCLWK